MGVIVFFAGAFFGAIAVIALALVVGGKDKDEKGGK